MVMVHAVPSALSGRKSEASCFERRWNQYVSPGQTVYAHRGMGREMIEAGASEDAGATCSCWRQSDTPPTTRLATSCSQMG
jgi:hypothetical protein